MKQKRKIAIWVTAFPKQHAKLTQPASDHKAARLESAKERRLLDGYARRIRARTPARAAQERQYREEVKEWLKLPENAVCAVWNLSASFRDDMRSQLTAFRGRELAATQCHHVAGRRGKLLLDKDGWLAVSDAGHRFIHDNPQKAIELGLLSAKGRWNTPL